MEEKIIDLRTWKQKKEDLKESGKKKLKGLAKGVRENLDVIVVLTPVVCTVVGGATKIVTNLIKTHNINAEIDYKQRTIYDHSLGRHIELKRPLTDDQAVIIEERRSQGEKLHTILDSMNLLKH